MVLIRLLVIALLMIPQLSTQIQAQPPGRSATTQQLVDELKRLTGQAERERTASYRFLDQLRELTARYDWPWNRRVLFDDFRDGDFARNPVWYANADNFWVTRSIGLRSQLQQAFASRDAQRQKQPTPEEAIIGMILGGVLQQEQQGDESQRGSRPHATQRADISTPLNLGNAFAITIRLSVLGRAGGGAFEFGPYQGQDRESGYRLAYLGGARPTLQLISYRRGFSSVLDAYQRGPLLGDGNMHTISWRRSASGVMQVLLNGKSLFSVRDRGYRGAFSGFVMTNRGGDYAIRSVTIDGIRH